jgi:NAD dependent epimerase/dehydratase family enzyme
MVSSIKANQWTLKFKTRMCASGIHTVGKLDKAVEESDEKLVE